MQRDESTKCPRVQGRFERLIVLSIAWPAVGLDFILTAVRVSLAGTISPLSIDHDAVTRQFYPSNASLCNTYPCLHTTPTSLSSLARKKVAFHAKHLCADSCREAIDLSGILLDLPANKQRLKA